MAVPPPPFQDSRVDACPPDVAKAALRTDLRRVRIAFAGGIDGAARTAALVARLTPLLARRGPVAGYVAHRGEPDILPFLAQAHEAGFAVTLPHVGTDRRMHFAPWHPDIVLTAGALGILQPEAAAKELVPAIVLTPLVGFDRGGHRLGQGAGYYDRWFAAHPHAMRIGIAWSVQEVPALPRDDWDVPLHAIVTEKEWIAP